MKFPFFKLFYLIILSTLLNIFCYIMCSKQLSNIIDYRKLQSLYRHRRILLLYYCPLSCLHNFSDGRWVDRFSDIEKYILQGFISDFRSSVLPNILFSLIKDTSYLSNQTSTYNRSVVVDLQNRCHMKKVRFTAYCHQIKTKNHFSSF